MIEFSVMVFDYGATLSTAFQGHVKNWTGKIEGLTFGTKNPGGFSSCSFTVNVGH